MKSGRFFDSGAAEEIESSSLNEILLPEGNRGREMSPCELLGDTNEGFRGSFAGVSDFAVSMIEGLFDSVSLASVEVRPRSDGLVSADLFACKVVRLGNEGLSLPLASASCAWLTDLLNPDDLLSRVPCAVASRSAIDGLLSAAAGSNRESVRVSPEGRLGMDSPLPRGSAWLTCLLNPDGRLGCPSFATESARLPAIDGLLSGPSFTPKVVLINSEGRRGGSFGGRSLSITLLPVSLFGSEEAEDFSGPSDGRLPGEGREPGALLLLRCKDGEAALAFRDGVGGALLALL